MKRESKTTRTFATTDKVWDKAKRKAQREGTTVSEKLHKFLQDYVSRTKKKSPESIIEV